MLRQATRDELLKIEDVSGTGIGDEKGHPVLVVMLRRDNKQTRQKIEKVLRGTHYKVVVTGEFSPRGADDS